MQATNVAMILCPQSPYTYIWSWVGCNAATTENPCLEDLCDGMLSGQLACVCAWACEPEVDDGAPFLISIHCQLLSSCVVDKLGHVTHQLA